VAAGWATMTTAAKTKNIHTLSKRPIRLLPMTSASRLAGVRNSVSSVPETRSSPAFTHAVCTTL